MKLIFSISFPLLLLSLNVHSQNRFISNNGNDANSGLSWATAFATIQAASDIVDAGDTVWVENGTYAGFDIRGVNGTALSPIVFIAFGSEVIINQAGPIREDGINVEGVDYVEINGFQVHGMVNGGNGIRLVLSDGCIVRHCYTDDNDNRGIFTGFTDDILIEYNICSNTLDEHGIYVSNSSDRPIVRFNQSFGNNSIGIHFNGDLSSGGDGIIADARVYGNIIYNNNQAAGINMDGVENPWIYNNLIYNNHSAQGIALFQQDGAIPTSGAKVFNNTIIVPDDGRWGILVKQDCQINTEIFNNIIINNHAWRGCIAIEDTDQFSSNYNITNDKMSATGDGSTISLSDWQNFGFDASTILADPEEQIFKDPLTSDYHLLMTSQAIDAGTNTVSSIVQTDLEGIARPQAGAYDIGCFEYSDDITPIDVFLGQNTINLYPNPTSNAFEITGLVGAYWIEVLDVNGQLIQTIYNQNAHQVIIQLNDYPSGLYFVKIYHPLLDELFMQKILKN